MKNVVKNISIDYIIYKLIKNLCLRHIQLFKYYGLLKFYLKIKKKTAYLSHIKSVIYLKQCIIVNSNIIQKIIHGQNDYIKFRRIYILNFHFYFIIRMIYLYILYTLINIESLNNVHISILTITLRVSSEFFYVR